MKELSIKIKAMASKIDIMVKLSKWLADTLRSFPEL